MMYLLLAGLATPLVISVHSVVGRGPPAADYSDHLEMTPTLDRPYHPNDSSE